MLQEVDVFDLAYSRLMAAVIIARGYTHEPITFSRDEGYGVTEEEER